MLIIYQYVFMARPQKHRTVRCNPAAFYFKPRGIPLHRLEEIVLDQDELEALRFADLLKYSQEEGAKKMKISRATFGRIVSRARHKFADGLLNGKAIRINENPDGRTAIKVPDHCSHCGKSWKQIMVDK